VCVLLPYSLTLFCFAVVVVCRGVDSIAAAGMKMTVPQTTTVDKVRTLLILFVLFVCLLFVVCLLFFIIMI
jgi:F0F1-type ATP synthase membrane subunit c/vacuolar-type H+-ATPase subunit K